MKCSLCENVIAVIWSFSSVFDVRFINTKKFCFLCKNLPLLCSIYFRDFELRFAYSFIQWNSIVSVKISNSRLIGNQYLNAYCGDIYRIVVTECLVNYLRLSLKLKVLQKSQINCYYFVINLFLFKYL